MDEFETAPGRRKVLKKYGMSQIDFDRLLEEQGGVCAVCSGKPSRRNFCVDHDHASGDVRGILCGECNIGLGKFKDSVDSLEAAIEYLKKHGKVPEKVS